MSKIVIAFLVVVIVAGFAIILTGVNSPTGAFGVDASLVTNPIYLIGSLTLDPDFLDFLEEDKSLLFGPTDVCIPKNNAVRSDFFEVNGILECPKGQDQTPAGCVVGQCEIVTTLKAEILANQPTTEKERNLVLKILGVTASDRTLEEELDCLLDIYSRQSLEIGSDTYFNVVKNCYVRAIKDLGILEQTYIDEPEAFFYVQKLQAIEVDLQHMLAIEDEKAKLAPITPTPVPLICEDLSFKPHSTDCVALFDGSCNIDCTEGTPADCAGDTPPCDSSLCTDNGLGACVQLGCHEDANCGQGCCKTPCLDNTDCTAAGATCSFGVCTKTGGINCCYT